MCCANTANTLKVLHQEIEKENRCSHADLCVVYMCCANTANIFDSFASRNRKREKVFS